MKNILIPFIFVFVVFGVQCRAEKPSKVLLNSLGYRPTAVKVASVAEPCSNFVVKDRQSGKAVFSGNATGPFSQADVGQNVWMIDFSKVDQAGQYFIEVEGVGQSLVFELAKKSTTLLFKPRCVRFTCGVAAWRSRVCSAASDTQPKLVTSKMAGSTM
jgi:hypothetical protein